MDEDMTEIAMVKGTGSGTRRYGLTEAQRTGRACLVCQGTEDLTTDVGWVGDVQVKVHSYHLGQYQLGKTIPPTPSG
jgi:hypothetical protein